MIRRDEVYKIGKLGKPHGVKGEITFAITDDVFDRVDAEYLVLDIDGILVPFFFEEYRFRSNETALVKFEGIDTQDQARNITGCGVFFPRSLADSADTGEMSLPEIVGYMVVDAEKGKTIGRLDSIDDTTENVLFEITADDGNEILVPVNPDWIKDIDGEARKITMTLPDGILDLG